MGETSQILTAVALSIALSASSGFRVFIPLLAASLAGKMHWVGLPQDMAWMGSWPALISFSVASVIEIAAYYIPVVDNFLDALAAPLSVAAGTVLAASFLPLGETAPLIKWTAALIAGGGAAGTIHAGTGLLRLLSTKTTAGTGNFVVASTENAAAIGSSVFSFLMPVVMALLLLILIVWILSKLMRRFNFRKRA